MDARDRELVESERKPKPRGVLGTSLLLLVFRFRTGVWGWLAARSPRPEVETEVAP